MNDPTKLTCPRVNRRQLMQMGGLGLLGVSAADVGCLRASAEGSPQAGRVPKKVVYIFLSGGPPQHETFDPKPEAPQTVRGEFGAIATKTPGMFLCEHLPLLAQRSDKFALLRSLHHRSNDHIAGTTIMVSGDTRVPLTTPLSKKPSAEDTPGIVALAGFYQNNRGRPPGAVVLPEYIGQGTGAGRITPGQTAGRLGSAHDPWLVKAASDCLGWGACPHCFDDGDDDAVVALGFQHEHSVPGPVFEDPSLSLPATLSQGQLKRRISLLEQFEGQRQRLDRLSGNSSHDRFRQQAISLLTSSRLRRALDFHLEDDRVLDAYGRNKFGWSLLLCRRLLEAGVSTIQVSLGRNGTWDLHRRIFPLLKDYLLPPTDLAVSAFLDDLAQRGMLDQVLVVMAGEFGRTPRISAMRGRRPGRDHWGPLQSVMFAGGGVVGGRILGASDKLGGFPKQLPKTPEDLAATIFDALGIAPGAKYRDIQGKSQPVYLGTPITELYS